jgi:hypothetical protein
MTLKKMLILASMALAVVAFVAPASASAARWVHWEAGVETTVETITEDFTGWAEFHPTGVASTNFGCEVHAHVTGSTTAGVAHGKVTSFEITTSTCKGEGGFTGCELKSHTNTAAANPWTVHVNTNDFVITNVSIQNEYKGCLVPPANLSFPEITAEPEPEATKINCLTISGAGLNISTAIEATGELCAYHEGTYGIE